MSDFDNTSIHGSALNSFLKILMPIKNRPTGDFMPFFVFEVPHWFKLSML